ncbi:hypothetical protein DFP72DRAFT_420791, partial [Ephemerocybe angulata]
AVDTISITLVRAVFYLCLFALLGGGRRYLWGLSALFLAMMVPTHALYWITSSMWTEEPTGPLDDELGYPCSPEEPETAYYKRLSYAVGIVSLSGALIILAAGVVTFAVRYRGQRNGLIKTIQRQGAQYYLAALVISVLGLLRPIIRPNDESESYWTIITIFNSFLGYLYPIFSDRLLLKLQRYDRAMSRQDVSELIFGPRVVPDGSDDDYGEESNNEGDSRTSAQRAA